MKIFLLLSIISHGFSSEQCRPPTDNCGPISLEPGTEFILPLHLFSEPRSNGIHTAIDVNGPFACINDIPSHRIRSVVSTGSIQLTFHYGKDCVGHVLSQYHGGNNNITDNSLGQDVTCPGSIFVKFNRYGSC